MKLTLDPSIRYCGAAVFDGFTLGGASTVINPAKRGQSIVEMVSMARAVLAWSGPDIQTLVIERMQIRLNSPGNPNTSVVPLLGVAYAVAGMLPHAALHEYLPHDWKGSYDGIECTRRVRERLSPEEFARIELPASACAECRKHFGAYCLKGEDGCGADHVYDAVGIGLKHGGRFERRRVIAR